MEFAVFELMKEKVTLVSFFFKGFPVSNDFCYFMESSMFIRSEYQSLLQYEKGAHIETRWNPP